MEASRTADPRAGRAGDDAAGLAEHLRWLVPPAEVIA
jgi:hypothetical protein